MGLNLKRGGFLPENEKENLLPENFAGDNLDLGGDDEGDVTQTFQIELDYGQDEELRPTPKEGEDHVPTIWVEIPEQEAKSYPIQEAQVLSFGRLKGDILIPHRSVSGLHGSFSFNQGVFSLTDKGSSNGTFLNGERIKPNRPVLVDGGDKVHLGLVRSWVSLPHPEAGPPPPPVKEKKAVLKKKVKPLLAKKKKDKSSRAAYDLAAPFFRLVAFLGDALMACFLVFQLADVDIWSDILEELTRIINSVIVLDKIFVQLILASFFRPICTFLFGVSLMQGVMGMRGGHGYLRNRMGGVIRELLDLALGIFVIFDLPLFFSKRSVKEVLSGTAVVNGSRSLRLLGIPLVLVLGVVFFFTDDYFSNWDYRKAMVVGTYSLPPLKTEAGVVEKASFFDLSSKTFQLSSFPSVDQKKLTFMLSYSILSQNKKKIFRPRLSLFVKKYNQWASIEVSSTNPLRQQLKKIFLDDKSMEKQYPEIAKILFSDEKKKLHPDDFIQIQELLRLAFSFDIKVLIDRMSKGHFVFAGFLQLRQDILKRFGMDVDARVQWAKINNRTFLRVIPKRSLIPNLPSKMYFIPIDTFGGPIYQINYFERKKGEVVAQTLLQYIFNESKFYFEEEMDSNVGDLTLGQCLDHLLGSGLSYDQWLPLYRHYYSYVGEVLEDHFKREGNKANERKFLLREISSLAEAEGVLAKRYKQWSERFGSRGFQFFLRKLKE